MAPFEFAKLGCKYKGVQGAECRRAPLAFWKSLKWKNKHHHTDPWENYPKVIYGIAIFEFVIALGNFKRNEGSNWKITTTPKLEGGNAKWT